MLTYIQALVMGLAQGVTELFPVSSLAQGVLLPTLAGWTSLAKAQSQPESFFLVFLVGLHVATATALLIHFREDWKRLIAGFARTSVQGIRTRKVPWKLASNPDERIAWILVVATIPAGITGLAFEHLLRVAFAKPLLASVFLIVNGAVLLVGERRRRADNSYRKLETMGLGEAAIIGSAQVFALIAGISRSGITMVAGLVRGLDHKDAARLSFLLATPIIMAAGLYKLPDLLGPLGNGIRLQVLAGSIVAGIAAYAAVRWLMDYFETRTLTPFAIFCLIEGAAGVLRFSLGH